MRGWELRQDPLVDAAISAIFKERRDASIKTAVDVTNEFLRVAYADPGRIVQHRRLCCRYCWGADHRYQWRDMAEYAEALRVYEEAERERKSKRGPKGRPLIEPSDDGGYGFRFNNTPHPDCPHCLGEGKPDVYIADTTKLTPEDRRMIERIEVTKDGIKIRFRNQQDALTKAGQMMGGFKSTVVLQNPDGTPVNNAPTIVQMSPEDAADVYKKWMNGEGEK
jgi:phage terminase small subunit